MEIRNFKDEDLDEAASGLNQSYDIEWAAKEDADNQKARDYLKKFLDFEPNCCLVAVDNGKFVGAVMGYSYSRKNEMILFIQELYVIPGQRKNGIGKKLVTRLRDSFEQNPKIKITPIVNAPTGVFNFYNSLGFEKDQAFSFYDE